MSCGPRCILIIFAIASVCAGCGREGSSYAAKADAICGRIVADARALYRTAGGTRVVFDRAFTRIVRARGAALAELHKLVPPADRGTQVDRMLAHFDKSQRLLREGERGWGQDEEAPFLIVFASREAEKGHAVARELGLDDCAEF